MADIIHAFVFFCCTLSEYRSGGYGAVPKSIWHSSIARRPQWWISPFRIFTFLRKHHDFTISLFHLFTFSLFHFLTKTPRFHLFTFSPFHLFTISVLTKTPRFHIFTFSHFHIINLQIRCYRPLSRPRWQSPHGGSSSGKGGETFQPAALES